MASKNNKKRKLEEKKKEKDQNLTTEKHKVPLDSEESEETSDEDESEDETETESDDEEEETSETLHKEKRKDKKVKEDPGPRTFMPGGKVKVYGGMYCDESAYDLYHRADIGYSCLSFDIIHDQLGDNRTGFPLTCYLAAGTQDSKNNNIIVMKMSNLNMIKKPENEGEDEDSDDSYDGDADWADDDDDENDEDNEKESKKRAIKLSLMSHPGAVNRIKTISIQDTTLAATWSETGKVYIWNMMESMKALEKSGNKKKETKTRSVFSFNGHTSEGFALDWNPLVQGRMASGDCKGGLHNWTMTSEGSWVVAKKSLVGHTDSVEDLQWSPNEANVLASCSVDKSIRIWDVRCDANKACKLTMDNSHDSDVNVISWNKLNSKFIASGGDDGVIKLWDLTMFKSSTPLNSCATFKHHSAPITSIQWSLHDSSLLVASGEDDQITIWDVAMEDVEDSKNDKKNRIEGERSDDVEEEVLPQLLFVHKGQQEIKEVKWHPQAPGVLVSTAFDGFNIFKTANL